MHESGKAFVANAGEQISLAAGKTAEGGPAKSRHRQQIWAFESASYRIKRHIPIVKADDIFKTLAAWRGQAQFLAELSLIFRNAGAKNEEWAFVGCLGIIPFEAAISRQRCQGACITRVPIDRN